MTSRIFFIRDWILLHPTHASVLSISLFCVGVIASGTYERNGFFYRCGGVLVVILFYLLKEVKEVDRVKRGVSFPLVRFLCEI